MPPIASIKGSTEKKRIRIEEIPSKKGTVLSGERREEKRRGLDDLLRRIARNPRQLV